MPWNTICTVILYLAQGALAVLGIIVSLKPQPPERHKLLISVFIIILIVSISAGISLQLLNNRDIEEKEKQYKKEMDEQKKLTDRINGELYISQLSRERLQGVGGARKEPITAVRGTKYGTIGSFKQQKKYPLNVLSVTLTRNSYRGPPIMLIRRKIRLSEARRNVLR